MTTRRQEPPVNEDGSRRKKRRAHPLRKPPVQSQHGCIHSLGAGPWDLFVAQPRASDPTDLHRAMVWELAP